MKYPLNSPLNSGVSLPATHPPTLGYILPSLPSFLSFLPSFFLFSEVGSAHNGTVACLSRWSLSHSISLSARRVTRPPIRHQEQLQNAQRSTALAREILIRPDVNPDETQVIKIDRKQVRDRVELELLLDIVKSFLT